MDSRETVLFLRLEMDVAVTERERLDAALAVLDRVL